MTAVGSRGLSLRGAPLPVKALIGITVALTVAYTVSVLPGMPGRPGAIPFWETWVYCTAYAGCALICLARAVHVRAERGAWLAMSAALISSAAGSVGWAVVYSGEPDAPYVSFADVLWLGFYPLSYAAVVVLLRARVRRFHRSMWLDGLVSGLTVAALGSAVAFDALISVSDGDALTIGVNLAYPAADLLLIGLIVGIFGLTGWRPGRAWLVLGSGLVINAAVDSIYLFQAMQETYVEGTWLDALWLPAVLLMGLASWQPLSDRRPHVNDWRAVAIPSASALVAVGVLAALAVGHDHGLTVIFATTAVIASIARTALTFREVSQLGETRRQALTDELTGLPNRRALNRRLDEAIAASRATALLLIDLDGFKELNDALGHHVGDELLQQLGERLSRGLRDADFLARLGGDEFAVLLAGAVDAAGAGAAADRLRATLDEPFTLDEIPVQVDASIGTAVFPGQARTAVELLKQADVAMYQAKRDRSGIAVYEPERDVHSRDRLVLLGQLRDGIARGELVLHYQPQIEIATGRLSGLEALVRWEHPEQGLLFPPAFLSSVEQTNLMRPFTERVLADALAQAAAWTGTPLDVPIAVNVAAPNLLDTGFPDTVARLLQASGIAAGRLRIEVTENAVMADADRALAVLARLREQGIGISIDDFGTGHSSLARLKAMPVDELKIDKGFVLHLERDDQDAAIVEAAITLAHRLDLKVTAEGVETPAGWERLRDFGCHTAQGFFLSRPLPALELELWAHTREQARVRGTRE
jgi:diguanylate cyclase